MTDKRIGGVQFPAHTIPGYNPGIKYFIGEYPRKGIHMEITVFAKKRKTKEGKAFTSYLTKMVRKSTGETVTASVKFREECGSPKLESCPCNIIVDKKNANMSSQEYVREDTGEAAISYTLWVSAWEKGSDYIDKSLDDFE